MLRTIIFSGIFLIYSTLDAQKKDTLRLFVADQTLYAGDSYSFPFYSSNFDSIVDFQFTLSLSQEYVDSASLFSNNLLLIPDRNFNWIKDKNQLGLLWDNPSSFAKSVPPDSSLFSIYLKMKKNITVRDLIKILYKGFVPPECINTFSFSSIGLSLDYDPGVIALILANNDLVAGKSEIEIYPNPCKAGATLQLKAVENITSYQWFNLEGKSISAKQTLNSNQFSIPTHLAKGSYFVHFYGENNKFAKARIEIID